MSMERPAVEDAETSDCNTENFKRLPSFDDTEVVKNSDSNDVDDKTTATAPVESRTSDKDSVHDDKVEDAETSDSDADCLKRLPLSDDTKVVKGSDSDDVEDKISATAPEEPKTSDKDSDHGVQGIDAKTSDFGTDCLKSLPSSDDTKVVKDSDSNDVENKTSATAPVEPGTSDKDSVHDDKGIDAKTADFGTDCLKSLPSSDDTKVVKDSDSNDVENKTSATAPVEPGTSDKDSVHDDRETKHPKQPSKPSCLEIGSDFILLGWDGPQSEGVEYYEIKYKVTSDKPWNRKLITTEDNTPQFCVRGLLQDNGYLFKVRAQYMDDEGEFSEPSDTIHTIQSPALAVLNFCIKLQDGKPAIYKLPVVEKPDARNEKYKTRKCEIESSHPPEKLQEKTIMMIGATGAGKSTLIDGMVNHLLGVKWEDDFRFKIIDLMDEEAKKESEAESQTDWITSYRVHPMNKSVQFIYNIIDTPGFGDTRGLERDQTLVDQIREFFTTKSVQGIETIDAICFVTQASQARLTHTQHYIFGSILSIFGKDMKNNIIAMITFADGEGLPVLNALKLAEVPVNKHFSFNNLALFEENSTAKSRFGKMFWDMGSQSYDGFFSFLPQIQPRSLQLTAEVLQKREQLNVTVAGLLPQIEIGLEKLETLRKEKALVVKFSKEIAENKNFEDEITEGRLQKVNLMPGECVTHCSYCDHTCHYPCGIESFIGKLMCGAMSYASCTVCPGRCGWRFHGSSPYRYVVAQVKVKKTSEDMKKKFKLAEKGKFTKEELMEKIREKFTKVKDNVCNMIEKVRNYGNYLRQNALKTNPLTELEYLDVLIRSEQQQKKPGFHDRVAMLERFKRTVTIKTQATEMSTEEFLKSTGFQEIDP